MVEKIKAYAYNVLLQKVAKRGVRFLISWASAHELNKYGVTLSEPELLGALYMGITWLLNHLKHKYPENKFIAAL